MGDAGEGEGKSSESWQKKKNSRVWAGTPPSKMGHVRTAGAKGFECVVNVRSHWIVLIYGPFVLPPRYCCFVPICCASSTHCSAVNSGTEMLA